MTTNNDEVIEHQLTTDDTEAMAVRLYWTEERMQSAQPRPLPEIEVPDAQLAELLAPSPWEQTGTPTHMETVPAYNQPLEQEVEELGREAMAVRTFTTTKVANMNVFPYQAVGKLFMTFDGVDYIGSAWTIAECGVFTAGHCVYDTDTDKWASNVMFKPRYSNGHALGTWHARALYSLTGWTKNHDWAYDMGAFLTTPIRPSTGSLGWMANYSPNQGPYTSIGYPAAVISGYAFDGKYMWQSVGDYISGTGPIQMHNNMTGGCSGGPWAVWRNGSWRANGLNSFRYSNSNTLYSPYFGNSFLKLYKAVKDCP